MQLFPFMKIWRVDHPMYQQSYWLSLDRIFGHWYEECLLLAHLKTTFFSWRFSVTLSFEVLVNGAKMNIYNFIDNSLYVNQQFISHFTWLMLSKIFISGFTETPLGLKMNLVFVQEKKYPSALVKLFHKVNDRSLVWWRVKCKKLVFS